MTCGFALRNLVDLPAFFAELARVVRPGRAHRPARRRHPAQPRVRFGNGIYFGKVVPKHRRAAARDGAAYRYLPKSVAYLPDAGGDGRDAARGRVRRCAAPPAVGRAHAAAARHAGLTRLERAVHARRRTVPLDADLDLNDSPRATATCSSATASGSPAAASPLGSRSTRRRRSWRRSSTTTGSAAPAGRSRSAALPFARQRRRADRARRRGRARRADGRRLDHELSGDDAPVPASSSSPVRPEPAAASCVDPPRSSTSTATSPPSPPPATRCAPGRMRKAVIARPIVVDVRPADRRARRAAPPEGVVRVELPLLDRRVHRRLARAARARSTATT